MNPDLPGLVLSATVETLYMTLASTLVALLIGLPLGIVLVVTEKGQILENQRLNSILGTVINALRSFPSLILIILLLPVSRFLVGTTLGSTAAIVPLSIGSAPFVARIFETSLKQVDKGKIEAALAMGASYKKIILDVYLPEALPSLIRGFTISVITIIGFTTIAGVIGGGGLGSLAIRFGYQRYRDDIMLVTVVLLIFLVQGIQKLGDVSAARINKKRHKFDI